MNLTMLQENQDPNLPFTAGFKGMGVTYPQGYESSSSKVMDLIKVSSVYLIILALVACSPRREKADPEAMKKQQIVDSPADERQKNLHELDHVEGESQLDSTSYFISHVSSDSLRTAFVRRISTHYPRLDSIKSGYTEFDIHFIVEVFYKNDDKQEAALYLIELTKIDKSTVKAQPKLVGKHSQTLKSIQTPGDFYYYLMTIKRENNVTALASCIRKSGYEKQVSDGGERSSKTIKKDSIDFDNVNFEFDLYKINFTFNLIIDETFDSAGGASFGYWGGGFYGSVYLRKEENQIVLERYIFSGH